MSEVLERAADRIERDGWVQGDFFEGAAENLFLGDEAGRRIREESLSCCGAGAIWAETQDDILASRAMYAVSARIGHGLADYNDAPDRTAAEVIAALRTTAEVAR